MKILVYLLLSLSLSLTACANFKQTADNTSHKTDLIAGILEFSSTQ